MGSLRYQDLTDVVWIQTAFIGDVVLTSAATRLLHRLNPKIRQHLVTTRAGQMIFKDQPAIASTYVLDKNDSLLQSCASLNGHLQNNGVRANSAAILQAHLSQRSSLHAMYLRMPRVTYHEAAFSIFSNHAVSRIGVWHESLRVAALLEGIGVDREKIYHATPELDWDESTAEITQQAKQLRALGKKIALVSPGSVWPTKRWPIEKFMNLIDQACAEWRNLHFFLNGSPDEQVLLDEIESNTEFADRMHRIDGNKPLSELLALYKVIDLVISNDSAPIHLASAFGVPVIGIFGPTSAEAGFAALGEKAHNVSLNLDCRPCGTHGGQRCPKTHFRCMKDLPEEMILQSMRQILNER
jgi:heptosyltransferase-2